jgi:hydroxyacylglutathione hydrolase
MRIVPIPCLSDNYAYLVVCEETNQAAIVDASEASPVERAVLEAKVELVAIWSTHHHMDHVGGNDEVANRFQVREVYAHVSDRGRVPRQTRFLASGESFELGSLRVETLHIPGHTLGAIAYVVSSRSSTGAGRSVFTGDTLFVAGCGRLFEGTPAQMHASLTSLASLGDETHVYCGHEYTSQNLRFAHHVEPHNADVARAAGRATDLRTAGKPTVPSTVGDEKRTNPFLRTFSPEIRASVGAGADASDVEVFAAVRRAKDEFR